MFTCLSESLSVCFAFLSACLSLCLWGCLFISLSVCSSVCVPFCLSVCLSACVVCPHAPRYPPCLPRLPASSSRSWCAGSTTRRPTTSSTSPSPPSSTPTRTATRAASRAHCARCTSNRDSGQVYRTQQKSTPGEHSKSQPHVVLYGNMSRFKNYSSSLCALHCNVELRQRSRLLWASVYSMQQSGAKMVCEHTVVAVGGSYAFWVHRRF